MTRLPTAAAMFAALAVVLAASVVPARAQCPWDTTPVTTVTNPPADWTVAGVTLLQPGVGTTLTLNTITVNPNAELIFDNQAFTLEVNKINVLGLGKLTIGSPSCRFTEDLVIELTGGDDGTAGTKGIWVQNDATLDIHGVTPATTWTRITSTVQVGESTLVLEDNVDGDWAVGDNIVLASTDFFGDQSEFLTIASVSGNTVTTVESFGYIHWGADYEKAEVGHLTRNVVVRGDAASETLGFGCQIRMHEATTRITAIEVTRCGQKDVLGRYPVHWHEGKDLSVKGAYVRDSAIHHNYQRSVVVHYTDAVTVANNVAYDTFGHMFFLEDGSEINNVFDGNLGVHARVHDLIPTDATPAIFWITNPQNRHVNNVAVGGNFGFWYSLPDVATGSSYADFVDSTTIRPRLQPLLEFDNNVAHSVTENGLMMDDCLLQDGTIELCTWRPQTPPYPVAPDTPSCWVEDCAWEQAQVTNFLAYKCRSHGVWTRSRSVHVTSSVLVDNRVGVLMVSDFNIATNNLIIGETENKGNPSYYTWTNSDQGDRLRPLDYRVENRITGYSSYDNGGPQFSKNNEFRDFQTETLPMGETRGAGAFGSLENPRFMHTPANVYERSTLVNANEGYWDIYTGVEKDGPKGYLFLDLDGSATGMLGGWMVSDHNNDYLTAMRTDCVAKPEWNGYLCPPTLENWVQARINNRNTGATDFGTTVTNLEPVRASVWPFGATRAAGPRLDITGGDLNQAVRNTYFFNQERMRGYAMTFDHETPPETTLRLDRAAVGEWIVYALAYPAGTTFTATTDYNNRPLTEVASLGALGVDTYYFDAANEWLYVRVQMIDNRVSYEEGHASYYSSKDVRVTATCPGGDCTPANTAREIPAALVDPTDRYTGDLEACQAGAASPYSGKAFFAYDPVNLNLQYTIYHGLSDSATVATLNDATDDSVILYLPSAFAPLRGNVALPRTAHIKLFEGNVYLNIATAANPGGELRARLGCESSPCSAPAGYEDVAADATFASEDPIYVDGIDGNWEAGGWGNGLEAYDIASTASTTASGTGTLTVAARIDNYGCFYVHADWSAPGQVRSVGPELDLFQFWIKRADATKPEPRLYLEALGASDVSFSGGDRLPLLPEHITDYAVTTEWTRVTVPRTYMGMPATAVDVSAVRVCTADLGSIDYYDFTFDQIKWISDDGIALTTPSATPYTYETGLCTGGCTANAECDDGQVCTTDTCNMGTGECEYVNNANSCDDGLFCNGADTCAAGTCSQHAGNPCTAGVECANVCDEAADTCNVAAGTPCTDSDTNECTVNECNGSGTCAVVNVASGTTCNDGDACTTGDVCNAGTCAGTGSCACTAGSDECDDANPCTDDSCPAGTCVFTPNAAPCDDGNYCNGDDMCGAGSCSVQVAGTEPCPAVDGCLAPLSGRCNEATDVCTVCSNDCSGHGSCCGQVCSCNHGFRFVDAADCSVGPEPFSAFGDLDTPASISLIPDEEYFFDISFAADGSDEEVAGDAFRARLSVLSTGDPVPDIYVATGRIPTTDDYDLMSEESSDPSEKSVVVDASRDDEVYVMLSGPEAATFQFMATELEPDNIVDDGADDGLLFGLSAAVVIAIGGATLLILILVIVGVVCCCTKGCCCCGGSSASSYKLPESGFNSAVQEHNAGGSHRAAPAAPSSTPNSTYASGGAYDSDAPYSSGHAFAAPASSGRLVPGPRW